MPTPCSAAPKWPSARFVTTGRVTIAMTELIAVSEMFSATWPWKRYE